MLLALPVLPPARATSATAMLSHQRLSVDHLGRLTYDRPARQVTIDAAESEAAHIGLRSSSLAMKLGLNLRRPLAFVDLETTGTSPASDRVVEIAILKVHPDGREDFRCNRVNPGVPIPSEATAVHGISDADVADEPSFASYARSLNDFLAGCDIAGFNVAGFDLKMLEAEFGRAGVAFSREGRAVIDAMTIFHQKEPRDLAAAVRFYCGRDFPEAHSSEDDARAAADVLRAQLERYDDLPRDVEALHELLNPMDPSWIDPDGKFRWSGSDAVIAFGQHKDRTLQDLAAAESDYLEWMLGQDFSPEVMQIIRNALSGRLPHGD